MHFDKLIKEEVLKRKTSVKRAKSFQTIEGYHAQRAIMPPLPTGTNQPFMKSQLPYVHVGSMQQALTRPFGLDIESNELIRIYKLAVLPNIDQSVYDEDPAGEEVEDMGAGEGSALYKNEYEGHKDYKNPNLSLFIHKNDFDKITSCELVQEVRFFTLQYVKMLIKYAPKYVKHQSDLIQRYMSEFAEISPQEVGQATALLAPLYAAHARQRMQKQQQRGY